MHRRLSTLIAFIAITLATSAFADGSQKPGRRGQQTGGKGQQTDGHETDGSFVYSRGAIPFLKSVAANLVEAIREPETRSILENLSTPVPVATLARALSTVQVRYTREVGNRWFEVRKNAKTKITTVYALKPFFDSVAVLFAKPSMQLVHEVQLQLLTAALEASGRSAAAAAAEAKDLLKHVLVDAEMRKSPMASCDSNFSCRAIQGVRANRVTRTLGRSWSWMQTSYESGRITWRDNTTDLSWAFSHRPALAGLMTLAESRQFCEKTFGGGAALPTREQLEMALSHGILGLAELRTQLSSGLQAFGVWTDSPANGGETAIYSPQTQKYSTAADPNLAIALCVSN